MTGPDLAPICGYVWGQGCPFGGPALHAPHLCVRSGSFHDGDCECSCGAREV